MHSVLALLGFLLGTVGSVHRAAHAAEPVPLATDAEVTAQIARLKDSATRLSALRQLIATGEEEIYQVGSMIPGYPSPEAERIAKRAAKAAIDAADLKTVSSALDSPDLDLQWYGIAFCRITDPKEFPDFAVLIPKVKKLAATGGVTVRAIADEQLQQLPEFHDFLAQRAREETSLNVIMTLVYVSNGDGFESAMDDAARRLLARKEQSIRSDALGFIGFNSNDAPMYKVHFSRAVFDRVVQLSTSKSSAERADVADAMGDPMFQAIAPAASRTTLLKLTSDADAKVRVNAIFGLSTQRADPAVQAAIKRLLHDQSPEVVYFTILADGPARHRSELESLAKCADREISQFAREKLAQIAKSAK
jgi:hypothetical protein